MEGGGSLEAEQAPPAVRLHGGPGALLALSPYSTGSRDTRQDPSLGSLFKGAHLLLSPSRHSVRAYYMLEHGREGTPGLHLRGAQGLVGRKGQRGIPKAGRLGEGRRLPGAGPGRGQGRFWQVRTACMGRTKWAWVDWQDTD